MEIHQPASELDPSEYVASVNTLTGAIALAAGTNITFGTVGNTITINASGGGTIDGSGSVNQLTYWVDVDTIGALDTTTYPSLTELSYVKGVTSAIQTQLNNKATSTHTHTKTDLTDIADFLLESEVDTDIKTLSLPASTTISVFGASLVDDVDAATARTTLGLVIGTNVQAFDTQLTSLAALSYTGNAGKFIRVNAGETDFELATVPALSDGDKGDVTVSASGATWTIDNLAITNAKINDVEWSKITSAPTTLSGYGITDGVPYTGATATLDLGAQELRFTNGAGFGLIRDNGTAFQISTRSDVPEIEILNQVSNLVATLDFANLSVDRSFSFPDNTGTLALVSDITGTNSGTNTGDQNIFQTIAVSGQSNVVADTTSDTLTLVAGTNITITTDAGTDSITINATGGGSGLTHPQVMSRVSLRF